MKLLKITKYVKNFVLDSLRELVQIIFLFICIVFPSFVNLAEIIRTILGGAAPTIENAKYYYLKETFITISHTGGIGSAQRY